MNDAETRCTKAIADGKYATKAEWCRAILQSTDKRIPTEWRFWAQKQLMGQSSETDPHGWAKRLKEREMFGEKIPFCAQRAWRQVLGIPASELKAGEAERTSDAVGVECATLD